MNPREKRLAMIVGAGVAAAVLYYAVNLVFLRPLRKAKEDYARLVNEEAALDELIASEKEMGKAWVDYAARTFSYQSSRAKALFGQDLKRIAERNGFDLPNFKPRSGTKIGHRTKIGSVAYRISVTGDYTQAIGFLRDIYKTPYLCQITSLMMAPLGPKSGRDRVKLDFTVETPVLPKIRTTENLLASGAKTMPEELSEPLPPFRRDLPDDARYTLLSQRNILRAFVPAPTNMVMIDNRDIKLVALRVKFFWDGRVKEQVVETVDGLKQKPVSGRGDVVEISGAYADGTSIGPERIVFSKRRNPVFKVAAHTPLPEAETILLSVRNEDEHPVFVSALITDKDDKQVKLPEMRVPAGQTIEIPEWEARQILLTARYESGQPALGGTFLPRKTRQVHTVPKESAEVVVAPDEAVPEADPPPDAGYSVSGTWIYPREDHIVQEMIVTNGTERKVISAGEPGAVDGGTLLAVHPLGGIVKMPSGNYYIYPLGKTFGERVLLDARMDSQLADAIDRWTQR